MGSAGLGLPMASPPQHSSFPILLIIFPLALSQFSTSYSYSPYYSTQTPASPYFPTSRFTSFTPYTSYPSVSYLRPGFRNQNSKNVFSSYRSLGNQMQRNQKMYPTFQTQRSYNQAYIKPKSGRNMIRAQVKNFYPDQISPSLTAALPEPEVTPAWQGKVDGRAVTKCHDGKILPFRARCNKVVDCKKGEDEKDCEWHKRSSVPTISGVRQLRRTLRKYPNVLVEFFAPWCPACVNFSPQLERLQAATKNIPLKVVKVNVMEDPELMKLFSVNSFPKIMLWSKRWGDGVATYMFTQHRTYDKHMGLTFRSVFAWIRQQFWLQS